jgi:hypothetical protein
MLKDEMDLLHCICRTLCLAGSLDPAKVKDKIVVCTTGVNGKVEKGLVVKQAGGIGMVLCNDAKQRRSDRRGPASHSSGSLLLLPV